MKTTLFAVGATEIGYQEHGDYGQRCVTTDQMRRRIRSSFKNDKNRYFLKEEVALAFIQEHQKLGNNPREIIKTAALFKIEVTLSTRNGTPNIEVTKLISAKVPGFQEIQIGISLPATLIYWEGSDVHSKVLHCTLDQNNCTPDTFDLLDRVLKGFNFLLCCNRVPKISALSRTLIFNFLSPKAIKHIPPKHANEDATTEVASSSQPVQFVP